MTLSRHARWSVAAALLAAAPASAQTAKPPDIPPVGTVLTYVGTIRTAAPEKPVTEVTVRLLRRVIETGADWFKVEYDLPIGDQKMHYREKHSADPFAPALTRETLLLTAQGDPVVAGESLTLKGRSDGGVTGSLFPLEVGKVAQYRFVGVGTAGEVPAVEDCKVESREPVTVPMGTYDAFAIRCTTETSPAEDMHNAGEVVFHYAGDIGGIVSFETHITISQGPENKPLMESWVTNKLVQIDKPPSNR